ncbi:MAG: hypothetical protein Q4G40_05800 [Brachybacterium sp.]|nr:hypothetical protein [Brachybacterium sp.]
MVPRDGRVTPGCAPRSDRDTGEEEKWSMEDAFAPGEDVLAALEMQASWIGQPGARGAGSWLHRRDIDLAGLLADPDDGHMRTLLAAEVVIAATGEASVVVDSIPVGRSGQVSGEILPLTRFDITARLMSRTTLIPHLALGIHHTDSCRHRTVHGITPEPSALAALVLHVAPGSASWTDQGEMVVLGTDSTWHSTEGWIDFQDRSEPGRRPLEIHHPERFDRLWTGWGAMHTDTSRTWVPAADRGRHPSLAHPRLVPAPPLVREEEVYARERRMALGSVQVFDLGRPVWFRPVLPLPDGARRRVAVWAGPEPGTPPRGADMVIDTAGEAVLLETSGTVGGRWLHVAGSPDIEVDEVVVAARVGVLPHEPVIETSEIDLAQLLHDGMDSLRARCQEVYTTGAGEEDDQPTLAGIGRLARTALRLGRDSWRSARALEAFLRTARPNSVGIVVDAIAPGGGGADLDEHTYALPGWLIEHIGSGVMAPRAAEVVDGIIDRLIHRLENGHSPAYRMTTLAAALDALRAMERYARHLGIEGDARSRRRSAAIERLMAEGRTRLRAGRTAGGRGAFLPTADAEQTTARSTALAVLSGLTDDAAAMSVRATLRRALADGTPDHDGIIRAALVRLGSAADVVTAHEPGDDLPPAALQKIVAAATGVRIHAERIHVRAPELPSLGLEASLPHPRGPVRVRWDGPRGEVEAPHGTHVLVRHPGASSPVWYNSGTTALERPDPAHPAARTEDDAWP